MLSNVTSILTTTVMLLHSILGCCAHHAHACEHESAVENCQVGHREHHSKDHDSAHADHHVAEQGDSSSIEADTHACVAGEHRLADANRERNHVGDEPAPRPHEPCQDNCDGGDCRFTQSSVVKLPTPNEGHLKFPASAFANSASVVCGRTSRTRPDSAPPGTLLGEYDRPSLQVWRL